MLQDLSSTWRMTSITSATDTASPATLEHYEQWLLGGGVSSNTIRQRLEFARRRLAEWRTFDQPPHVIGAWLRQYAGWTYNTYLGHLRSIYGWMIESGHLQHDPTARIKRAPRPSVRPNPIPAQQLEAALRTADAVDPRLRAWIALGALAGMRCHEIAQMRGDDIDENHIRIAGKWGVVAFVPTHPDLWEIARDYPTSGWWFLSPQRGRDHIGSSLVGQAIRKHFRTVGIYEGSVHRLRHTYCTNLSRAGVRPRVVQELMRHTSLETTMRYDAVDEDERSAAIRSLSLPTTTPRAA